MTLTLDITRGLPGSGSQVPLFRRVGATRWGLDVAHDEFAIVDEEDFDKVMEYSPWRLHSAGYACRKIYVDGRRETLLMHRLVMGLTSEDSDVHVDHLNHQTLDNRKANLSPGTQADNNRNTPDGPRAGSSSRFKGVGRYRGHWRATGYDGGRSVWLGGFETEEQAADLRKLEGCIMTLSLEITRGLPGAGKSTWAQFAIDVDRVELGCTAARVNRDEIRQEVYGKPVLTGEQEQVVTKIQHDRIRSLLRAGVNVIVDDTNLNTKRSVKPLQKIAQEFGANFEVHDFDVSVEQCHSNIQDRVAEGGRDVPRHVIQGMYDRYKLKDGFPKITPLPDPPKFEPYVPDTTKPPAWIVDVDGTLTTGPKDRSPYDFSKVLQDEPREATLSIVQALQGAGDKIIVLSGRDDSCAEDTLLWLANYAIHPTALHMRVTGDKRADNVIKAEIFDKYIRDDYDVLGVLDDRDQVISMWREIGLTAFQADYGNF